MYREFFAKALELQRRGQPFATATVVRVDKPTSGQPGDKAIITLDGELFGWIGGSCARPTVLQEALAALRDDRPRLIRLSSEPDNQQQRNGMTDLSMTCFSGGTMEIYIDPHQPRPDLLIVGNLPIATALVALGKTMGYAISGVRIPDVSEAVDGADRVADSLDGIDSLITPLTYVVVATHGDHDELAVERALAAGAGYVGLVASPKRSDSIRAFLRTKGFSEEDLTRVDAPAGLDIQARLPEEIALSILARVVQLRCNTEAIDWSDSEESVAESVAADPELSAEIAIDPICGMTVKPSGASNVYKYEGVDYYFCCGGCMAKFSAGPERYLTQNP
jgi:xanthine dehydrogenase accessory factor